MVGDERYSANTFDAGVAFTPYSFGYSSTALITLVTTAAAHLVCKSAEMMLTKKLQKACSLLRARADKCNKRENGADCLYGVAFAVETQNLSKGISSGAFK